MLKKRRFAVMSPLGPDVLLVKSFSGTEALGRPFRFQLEVISEEAYIDPAKLLGQPLTIHIELERSQRTISGIVTQFGEAGGLGRFSRYVVVIEPWIALLGLTADCRVLVPTPDNMAPRPVPEVLNQLFKDHGFSEGVDEARLYGTYAPREYVVQYRESALAVASRLMEEEGIYYYFRHDDGQHRLVLADSSSSHAKAPGYETIPYYPPTGGRRERDHFSAFDRVRQIQPGARVLSDYDFQRPKALMVEAAATPNDHAHAEFEVFDYPGGYTDNAVGASYARVGLERDHSRYERFNGVGDVLGVGVGHVFGLTGHPNPDHNRDYLITNAHYEATVNGYESGGDLDEVFQVKIAAVEAQRQFRPTPSTPKPVVHGLHSAVVIGPSTEEIWTDKYGRVQVCFHWDRVTPKTKDNSCFVRVAQTWAGDRWGAVQLPRIGQEVLVEFLEGDPDRPLVTGAVYNADNMPPYALPDNKTQSGVKSRSTKGAGPDNFNEIRFEDKKGEEHVYVHAEKDLVIVVEHDESREIGNDRVKHVVKNETVHVDENRTETVGKEESITIAGGRTEKVAKAESITIGGARTETVGGDETIAVTGIRTETVGKDESVSIGGGRVVGVGKDDAITVANDHIIKAGGNRTVKVGKAEDIQVGGERTVQVGSNDALTVGKKLVVSAGDELTLKCGAASIVMKKDGKIVIKGKDITLEGSGKVAVKASGTASLKGSKISQN